MGYPVAYRPSSGGVVPGAAFRAPSGPGTVIPFPSHRAGKPAPWDHGFYKPPQEPYEPLDLSGKNHVKSPYGFGKPKITPTNPFGKAAGYARRRRALGFLKSGLRLRSMLFRAIARYAIERAIDAMRQPRASGRAKGWTVSGRWGTYPGLMAGMTSAHTTGAFIEHNPPGPTFGHPWTGPPFDWAEYDSVETIENPITHAISYRFFQVGRGDLGTGPNPLTMPVPRLFPWDRVDNHSVARKNPWAEPYNPLWNWHPDYTELSRPVPVSRPSPGPMIDPNSEPISPPVGAPTPMPVPYPLIPHTQPNPYRSPSERTQRGPGTFPYSPPRPDPDSPGFPLPVPTPGKPPVTSTEKAGKRWISIRPGSRRAPRPYKDKRPPKRTKELKSRMAAFRGSLPYRILNGATEYQDYVDAIWGTLDRQYKSRGKLRVNDKALDIYHHLDKIDLEKAVKALIANEIQDFLFGTLGQISKRTAGKIGSPVDLHGRAFRKGQQQTRDAVNELVDQIMSGVFKDQ